MLKLGLLTCFLCMLLAAQTRDLRVEPISPAARQGFEKQIKVALVVGISAYPQGSGLRPLKYAARDADVLGDTLKSQGYLVRRLKDSDATRAVIRRTLRELSEVVSPEQGTFLFFFGGHGFSYKGVNYLAAFGVTADDLQGEGLPVKEVEGMLRDSKAKRKMLFVDACRNDPEQAARSTGQRSFEKLQASEGIRVLYSTKEGRVSYEDDALRQGIFTYYLAKGIQGEAAGGDGLVTFRDLAEYVTDRMRVYTVEQGQLQIPFEAGESSGDFLVSAGTPPPAGTPPLAAASGLVRPEKKLGATKVNAKDGLSYVWIPPGTFQMGCSPGDSECYVDEKPPHQVTISTGFWMGQTEVTQEAFERVTGQNPSISKGGLLPVDNVSWIKARSYCEAAGMRLPTQAGWEYAARAGSTDSRYGDLDGIAWHGDNSGRKAHEVGGKRANAWGLHDMLGNAMEWVSDWFGKPYPSGKQIDPHGPAGGELKVLRGGSWASVPEYVRVSNRGAGAPTYHFYGFGVRCAGD